MLYKCFLVLRCGLQNPQHSGAFGSTGHRHMSQTPVFSLQRTWEMPVTLIFKSLRRLSWPCSPTGTRMCPFLPPWNPSVGAPQMCDCWRNGVNRPGLPRTPGPPHVGADHSPPLVRGLTMSYLLREKRALKLWGQALKWPLSHVQPQGLPWGRASPSAPLAADLEACDRVVGPGGSWAQGSRLPSPWQTDYDLKPPPPKIK